MKSRLQQYLEGNSSSTFSIEGLNAAVHELKNITPEKATSMANKNGQLDIKIKSMHFKDLQFATTRGGQITARYAAKFEGKEIPGEKDKNIEGYIFIGWDGRSFLFDLRTSSLSKEDKYE